MKYKENLDIAGKEYTFVANRQARLDFNDMFKGKISKGSIKNTEDLLSKISTDEVLNIITYCLVKQEQNLKFKDAVELREIASSENEYGDKFDEFMNAIFEKTTVKGKKTIDFLEQKD
jgi:hypothetical protein